MLDQFRQQYPGVEAAIHEHDSQILVKQLAAGEPDIGLVALSLKEHRDAELPVIWDEVLLVASLR